MSVSTTSRPLGASLLSPCIPLFRLVLGNGNYGLYDFSLYHSERQTAERYFFALSLILILLLCGCGGSGSGSQTNANGTPAGIWYKLTVTATMGSTTQSTVPHSYRAVENSGSSAKSRLTVSVDLLPAPSQAHAAMPLPPLRFHKLNQIVVSQILVNLTHILRQPHRMIILPS